MSFTVLENYLHSLPSRGIPGGQLTVMRQHEVLLDTVFGAKSQKGDATTHDALYFMYSASKVLTCASVMRLIEESELTLDTPVRAIFPSYAHLTVKEVASVRPTAPGGTVGLAAAAFAEGLDICRPARTEMTLRHLFTMCGGFSYEKTHPVITDFIKQHPSATAREIANAMADMPLLFDPGAHFAYSLCHDVLLGILEEVSGMRAKDYIKQKMTGPLGIRELYYHKDDIPNADARMAVQYRVESDGSYAVLPICNFCLTPSYDSGGAGVITSASEYAKFADAMAMGGVGANGERILSSESVRLMYQNQLGDTQMQDYHGGPGNYGYGYGLGVRTLLSQSDRGNLSRSHVGEFGWGGAAGAYFLADPVSGVSISYTMHVLGLPFHGTYNEHPHNVIRDLVFKALEGNL